MMLRHETYLPEQIEPSVTVPTKEELEKAMK